MKKLFLCLAACAAASAQAHIHLEYEVAPASANYKASFQVGHGCGESPTRQLSVQVPDGFTGARPMPKPGWTLQTQREGERVTRITWTARTPEDMLANEQYDEFVLVARTPAQAGPVEWRVAQECATGRHDWTPKLEILPAAASGGHSH